MYYMPDFVLGAGETSRSNTEKVWSILLGNIFLLPFFCCFSMCIYYQSLLFHPIVIIIFIILLHTLLHYEHYYKNAHLIDKGMRINESKNSSSQQQAYILIVLNLFFFKASFFNPSFPSFTYTNTSDFFHFLILNAICYFYVHSIFPRVAHN